MHKPIAFKVRGGGNYSGTKGGAVKPNEKGGAGYLGYEDKTFTISTAPDQWICTTINNLSSQTIPMNEPAQPAPVGKPIRYLSVCSGMEAASVAWHPLGWQPVGFSEIEPFPCAILKHRFPNIQNYGSLTEHHTWPIEPGAIDLLVGGTPCQSYSLAGKRGGLNDPRGQLMLCFLDLAARLKVRYIIWENVPGVLSSGQPRGSDFATFLQGLVERGYGWAYRVLDAQHFGVPQRRRRVFVVACLGDWRAPAEVLSLREGLSGYLEAGGKKRKGVAADAGSGVEASGLHRTVGTLCADTHPGAYSGQDAYTGRLIPDQKPITQANVAGPLDAHYYKGSGSRQGGEREYVGQPIAFDTYNQTTSNTTQSVRSAASDVDHVGAVVYPINTMTLGGRPDPANDLRMTMGVGADGDPQFTLQAAHSHAVATPMAVRRLTPNECYRLQGFPDNWGRIPWKGKPAEECPDGPQYKACGNSMAVPVMRWIGERIAAVEASSHA